jgi:large subunit ribosomal protein L7Ae
MSSKTAAKKTVAKPAAAKASAPAATKASAPKSSKKDKSNFRAEHDHLFPKAPKQFGIGREHKPTTDLSRYVKWPRYVRIQRQRTILKKRLKIPPAINQFTRALDKNQASTLFRLLAHYRPESEADKTARLKKAAETEVKGKTDVVKNEKPVVVKYGLNHVTSLVESKKAKLVIIAHDVDPIELVVWLPALCRKVNVPYVIVKSKARLGQLVHKKTTSVVALTEVRKEDAAKLEQLIQNARLQYNDNAADRKRWGGGVMGIKAQHVTRKRERAVAKEQAGK